MMYNLKVIFTARVLGFLFRTACSNQKYWVVSWQNEVYFIGLKAEMTDGFQEAMNNVMLQMLRKYTGTMLTGLGYYSTGAGCYGLD